MGMMVSGANSGKRRIVLRNADGTTAGSISVSKPSSKKKKRLQYNFKEVSRQIMRAKTSSSAGRVVTKARGKVAELRRKLRTGEYDEEELARAILHAERLVRVAKKKVKHLKEEESAKKQGGPCQADIEEESDFRIEDIFSKESSNLSKEEMKEMMQQLQEEMERLMQELGEDSEDELKELSDELTQVTEELDPIDLEQLKKKHRSKELRDILEADLKYLKAMFDKLARDKQEASNGVSLQLGGMEVPVQTVEAPVTIEGANLDTTV